MHWQIRPSFVHFFILLLPLLLAGAHQANAAHALGAQPDQNFFIRMPFTRNAPPIPSIIVDAGNNYTCAIRQGALTCWGLNDYGQLGDGTTENRNKPGAVSGLTSGVTAIAAGSGVHTCAIVNSGAKCWGYNPFGQLGNNSETDSLTPVDVSGLSSGVTAITVGDFHSCAVVNDGVSGGAKCWGYNADGRAGIPTGSEHLIPADVPGLSSGVTAISAGRDFTCALVSGGVKCWGKNNYGQLGIGSNVDTATPTQVIGLTSGVQAITTGDWHACAFLTGDDVKCWGWNQYGQLGNNIFAIHTNMPVDVVDLSSGVFAISAGGGHSCALTGAGAECWGWNSFTQLGDGTNFSRQTPVGVSGLTSGVAGISAGSYHTCAVTNDILQCWGYNRDGGLGDGSNDNSSVPRNVVFD